MSARGVAGRFIGRRGPRPRRVAAVSVVFYGCLAWILLGGVNVAARLAMHRFPDAQFGGFVMAAIALPILVVLTAVSGVGADDIDVQELWQFFVTGMIVPGDSQIHWVVDLRDAGDSWGVFAYWRESLF